MSTDPDLCVVMETLDEYRNELPEGTYIKVCVSIKNIHNKLKKTNNSSTQVQRNLCTGSYCSSYWISKESYLT